MVNYADDDVRFVYLGCMCVCTYKSAIVRTRDGHSRRTEIREFGIHFMVFHITDASASSAGRAKPLVPPPLPHHLFARVNTEIANCLDSARVNLNRNPMGSCLRYPYRDLKETIVTVFCVFRADQVFKCIKVKSNANQLHYNIIHLPTYLICLIDFDY